MFKLAKKCAVPRNAVHGFTPIFSFEKGFALLQRDQSILSADDTLIKGEALTLIREHGETAIRVE